MSRPRQRTAKTRRKGGRAPVDAIWSDGGYTPTEAEQIRPTSVPSAIPRSLGDPPLTEDTAAEHHLAAVYEEAVRTATALAAVNGLLPDLDAEADADADGDDSADGEAEAGPAPA